MEAQVHITGYAGTEVESRGNGTVSAFRLACTPRIRTKSGWTDGNTTWIEVACFRTLAQHVAQSVHKGDPVLVVGKLRTGKRTARLTSGSYLRPTWSVTT